ncbi:hypothetical protein NKG94_03490 [Micromonospora sp. M12]
MLASAGKGNRYRGIPGGRLIAGGVLAASAVAAAASVRPWGRRVPSQAVSAGMWGSTAVTGAGSAFLLLYLLELAVKGTVTDRDRNSDWPGFADRLSWTAGAALFTGAAIAWRRRAGDVCVFCGKDHPEGDIAGVEYPTPEPPKPWVRYLAYAGCAGLTPYAVMHLMVANGRQPFGLRREDIIEGGAGGPGWRCTASRGSTSPPGWAASCYSGSPIRGASASGLDPATGRAPGAALPAADSRLGDRADAGHLRDRRRQLHRAGGNRRGSRQLGGRSSAFGRHRDDGVRNVRYGADGGRLVVSATNPSTLRAGPGRDRAGRTPPATAARFDS